MKKGIFLLAVLCVLLCLLLTGCGGAEADTGPEPDVTLDEIPEDDGLGGDLPDDTAAPDLAAFAGIYVCRTSDVEWEDLDILDDGTWTLYGTDATVTGWLEYDEEFDAIYAYSDIDGQGCRFEATDDGVYMASYGYFSGGSPDEDAWNEDAGGDGEYVEYESTDDYDSADAYDGWADEYYHVDVSEFEGTWYYEGDRAADRFIVIDAFGDWTLYSRASGDGEAAEQDSGYLDPVDEVSTYSAISYQFDGVAYRVFEFNTGILHWDDEGSFERLD